MTVTVDVVDAGLTRELRRAVLRPAWPVGSVMHGDDNPDAVHLAALDPDGSVVGSCVLIPRRYSVRPDVAAAWQLRAMATAPERRGQGVGAAVLARAVEEVAQRQGVLLWCDARVGAVEFYRRHGFVVDGPEFMQAETDIPHHHMSRSVPGGSVGT